MPVSDEEIVVFKEQDALLNFSPRGTAVDITGWTLTFTVRRGQLAVVIAKTIGAGITVVSAVAGTFKVAITATDLDINLGDYTWDVWRTNGSANTPLAIGRFRVKKSARYPA